MIKAIADDVSRSPDVDFERLYEGTGRQSIAPERLLRASLVQAFYSVRSERQLMEQIDYNLFVPLVRRSRDRWPCVGALDIFEEPRPVAGCGCRGEVP